MHPKPASGADDDLSSAENESWRELMGSYIRQVGAYVACATRDPDEMADLIETVWANAWLDRDQIPAEADIGRWLIGHARVVCTRWASVSRREVRVDPFPLVSVPDMEADEEVEAQRVAESELAKAQLRILSRRQLYAVWLHDWLGLGFEEMARAMNCGLATAKTHYYRGRETTKRRCDAAEASQAPRRNPVA